MCWVLVYLSSALKPSFSEKCLFQCLSLARQRTLLPWLRAFVAVFYKKASRHFPRLLYLSSPLGLKEGLKVPKRIMKILEILEKKKI